MGDIDIRLILQIYSTMRSLVEVSILRLSSFPHEYQCSKSLPMIGNALCKFISNILGKFITLDPKTNILYTTVTWIYIFFDFGK